MRIRAWHRKAQIVALVLIFGVLTGCTSSKSMTDYRVDAIIAEAGALVSAGSFAEAAQIYARYLERFPADRRLLYNYALVLADIGKLSNSRDVLNRLHVVTDHRNIRYLKASAGVSMALQEGEDARNIWKSILILDPLDQEVRGMLVDSLVDAEQFEAAYATVMEAYELHLFDAWLFDQLAELAGKTGRTQDQRSWEIIRTTFP